MIKVTNICVYNFENAIRGMRNPHLPQPLTDVLLCALEMLDELLDNEVKSVARDNTTKTF